MSVEHLFRWFMSQYGRRFSDMWAGTPADDVKAAWRETLADLGPQDIARGIDACRKTRDWPPSAPEFRRLCLPQIDYEASFVEAAHQWGNRNCGLDTWSHPAIFWAAVAIGNDVLAYPYRWMSNRWRAELDAAMEGVETGRLPREIPPRREVLPEPVREVATAEQVRAALGGGA